MPSGTPRQHRVLGLGQQLLGDVDAGRADPGDARDPTAPELRLSAKRSRAGGAWTAKLVGSGAKLMTPRRDIEVLDLRAGSGELSRALATRHTRLPVRDGEPDETGCL